MSIYTAHNAGTCGPLCPFCIGDEMTDEQEEADEEARYFGRRVRPEAEEIAACDTGD